MGRGRKEKRKIRRERRELKTLGLPLGTDESVLLVARPSLLVTWPKYVFTLGLYSAWRRRNTAVVTNQRILVNKGLFARSERSIPFDRILDATFLRKGYAGYTNVHTGPNRIERIGPLKPSKARRFVSEILSHR
jgi:Bacterial PH domain